MCIGGIHNLLPRMNKPWPVDSEDRLNSLGCCGQWFPLKRWLEKFEQNHLLWISIVSPNVKCYMKLHFTDFHFRLCYRSISQCWNKPISSLLELNVFIFCCSEMSHLRLFCLVYVVISCAFKVSNYFDLLNQILA